MSSLVRLVPIPHRAMGATRHKLGRKYGKSLSVIVYELVAIFPRCGSANGSEQ